MDILDIFFPKKCICCSKNGDYICSNCFSFLSFDTGGICLECSLPCLDGLTHPNCISKNGIDGVFCGITYNLIAKKLLYSFKYPPYVFDLAKFLGDLLYDNLIQQEAFIGTLKNFTPILIPIPLSHKKLQERGYNQSELIAKELSKKLGIKQENYLERIKDTKPHFKLKKEERKENIKNAFNLKKEALSKLSESVFIVDDVLTTGATLLEATKILKKNGVKKVWGICLARDK